MNALTAAPQSALQGLVVSLSSRLGIGETAGLITTLKATAFKGDVSDAQMTALLIVANQYGLNPWTKEIYAFPDKHNGIVPVVGVDGWSRIINEHKELDGIEFEYGPASGSHFDWIECAIFRKDRSKPIRIREFWSEVSRTNVGPWSSHPNRMHRHKALIQCARVAFGFAGIYDPDEAERLLEKDITPVPQHVAMPRAKAAPVSDAQLVDADPASAPEAPINTAGLASKGEKAFLVRRAGDKNIDLKEVCAASGITDFDNLTTDGFQVLKEALK